MGLHRAQQRSPEDYERGGRLKDRPPAGYYVDLTGIAADYGWERVPRSAPGSTTSARSSSRELRKTGGLSLRDAMLELYTPEELETFLSAATSIPAPPTLPAGEPAAEAARTPRRQSRRTSSSAARQDTVMNAAATCKAS